MTWTQMDDNSAGWEPFIDLVAGLGLMGFWLILVYLGEHYVRG